MTILYVFMISFLLSRFLEIRWTTTSKTLAQGIQLASCIREVTVSDLGWKTRCPEIYPAPPQSIQINSGIVIQIKPGSLPLHLSQYITQHLSYILCCVAWITDNVFSTAQCGEMVTWHSMLNKTAWVSVPERLYSAPVSKEDIFNVSHSKQMPVLCQ